MNVCTFTGFLVDDPVLSKEDGGVSLVRFTMVSYKYRNVKATGEKTRIPTYLKFEAWHTGAETIHKFAKDGSKMTINASAKNVSKDDRDMIFRVNEFDFANAENEVI